MSELDRLIEQAIEEQDSMNFESNALPYNQAFECLSYDEQCQLQALEAMEVNNMVGNTNRLSIGSRAGAKLNVSQAQAQARAKVNMVANQIASGALAQVPSASATPFQPLPRGRNVKGQPVAATFTVNIKRLTATIASNLPVILFGKTFSLVAYVSVIQSLLPAGVSLVAVQIGGMNTDPATLTNTIGNALKVRFAFTSGANTDIIEVTCNEVPMPTFTDGTATDPFEVKSFRYKISDSAQQQQYDIPVEFRRKTSFGLAGEQILTPSTYIETTDFKDNLVKIEQPFQIDKDSYVATSLTDVANFQVSLSFGVTKFVRQGANLL